MASATSSHASSDPFDLVFRAFCESFEQTAKQFTSGLEHSFAEHFSNRFLDLWRHHTAAPPPVAPQAHPPGGPPPTVAAAPQQQEPQQPISRLQGRPIPAPPKEDLRVFVRLPAEAPARDHNSYAIRTHVAAKVGIGLHQVPAAFKVNSGWAIRTTDATIRDLIVQRQSEWSEDLGVTNVEISQRWYTYAVANCPHTLTDLYGKELDYEAAARDEIACQTGLTPIRVRSARRKPNEP
ncbi:ribonuclease H-like protein [Hirsutella rhossiliensis]